jgi:glycosyltransferase involved in cell wall biosynthesis
MRIVHVTQYFLPWLGYQEFYLAREQIRDGNDVHVIASNLRWPDVGYSALGARGESQEMPAGAGPEYGIPTHRLTVRARLLGRLVLRDLSRTVAALRPDIVHAHGYLMPATAELARLRRKRELAFHLLVDEHQLPHQANNSFVHRVERKLASLAARKFVMPSVEQFVAVADGAREWLVEEYGCPESRVVLIPLGADTDAFLPDAAVGLHTRELLGIAADRPTILYSGKIASHKRIDVLINAVAMLPSDWNTMVLLVGDADPATLSQLESLAASARVSLHVVPAVEPSELARYFNAADVCAWPADATVSHLEAASCGKVIVIPDEVGIRDRIAAGNGVGVPVGDVSALAAALKRLLADPHLRTRMGRAGRALVESRYSWRSVASRFQVLYESMLRRRSPADG